MTLLLESSSVLNKLLNAKSLFRFLFGIAIIAVSTACLMPLSGPPLDVDHGDKLLHAISYLGLSALCERSNPARFVPLNASLLFLYSGIIEVIQQTTGYRTASLADMLANGSGIMTYLILCQPMILKLAKQDSKP